MNIQAPALAAVFEKVEFCKPSFSCHDYSHQISIIGRYIAAREAKSDDVIYLGRCIEQLVGGRVEIEEVDIAGSFQDYMNTSTGAMFTELLALEDVALGPDALPADRLRYLVASAAIVAMENDPVTRQAKSGAALKNEF